MKDIKNLTKDSRNLSYLLRHHPEEAHLNMDERGWVSIKELLANTGNTYDMEYLKYIVDTDEKKRYSISEDGGKIRANQGHSIPWVNPDLVEDTPPEILYHGTATRFLDSIYKEGIKSQQRNLVHLSKDKDTAIVAGKRHGKPVVLVIDTVEMQKDGNKFYRSANDLWFVNIVAPKYITGVIYE